jgi:hypothetical protein
VANLVSRVVEVKQDRIIFAADCTWVLSQECQNVKPVAVAARQIVPHAPDSLIGECSTLGKRWEKEIANPQQFAPAKVFGRASAMAVRTHDIALGDFFQDRRP